ncbi:MAG TPA: hypothetical protein VFL80_02590 [Thermoanaerobaculia bacterium]|nr:hypothetical protein [Thermoanaerobaculia bacterium]
MTSERFPVDDQRTQLVADFAVELRQMEDAGQLIHFVSPSLGELAWFPEWEHAERDLRHLTLFDIPVGTPEEPFEDTGEGWRIVIFAEGDFVYSLEGDSPRATHFPRRYRVPRGRYLAAWEALLVEFNAPMSLDEL